MRTHSKGRQLASALLVLAALAIASNAAPADAAPGDLDSGYGHEGATILEKLDSAYTFAVTKSGAVYLFGHDYDYKPGLVMKLRPDGHVDRRFGRNGRAAVPGQSYSSGIAVDSQGRPLVLTRPRNLTRLTRAGELDQSFGDGGTVTLPNRYPAQLFVDSEDRILVRFYEDGLLRLSPEGELPAAGTTPFPAGFEAKAMDLDPQDRVLLMGAQEAATSNPRVIRLTQSLQQDTSFGSYPPFSTSDTLALSADRDGGAWLLGGNCYRDCFPIRLNHMDADGTEADDFEVHRVPDGYFLEADRDGVIAGGEIDYGHAPYTGRLTRLRANGLVDRRWGADGSAYPISGARSMDIYGVESTSHGTYVLGSHGYEGTAVVRLSDERGTPDADGDGVADRSDPCPTVPRRVVKHCLKLPVADAHHRRYKRGFKERLPGADRGSARSG